MTQNNVYSGSTADDRRESDESPDSNEIRADIDQTRQSVGSKIDQLQARLDPNKLKQQAADTVQEMLTDTANSMTEYVRSNRENITTSLADAARRNPMPAALVGVGIGWLILESFSGGKSSDQYSRSSDRYEDRWENDRRNYSRRSGRSYEGYQGGSMGYQGGYQGSAQSFSQGNEYANEDFSTYREPNYSSGTNFQGGYDYGQSGQSQQRGSSSGSNPIAKAAGTVKETVGSTVGSVKETVGDMSQGLMERVGDVKERVTDAVQGVRQQAGEMGSQTQQTMQNSMQRASGSMHRAGGQMSEWQNRARYQGQRRGQQVMRNLEDNPMTYGIVALAAGAALAILLPQTRAENRAFGEMRDQVMEKGQEALQTAKTHAQEVANEIRPELEETARRLVSDVKEAGKDVVQTAQSEIRPVIDKAVSKSKEEARNAAQEVGVDPNKLTGDKSKSPINKDTLKGNWNQMKGEVKRKWGQITDDELTTIEGDYDKLVGVLQSRYGYARGRAEQEVNDYLSSQKA